MRTAHLLVSAALLAYGMPAQAQHYSLEDARNGGQLRTEIGAAITFLFDPCVRTDGITPAITRFKAIQNSEDGQARRLDFAIVRADYDYKMSLVDIACHELTNEEQREADEFQASVANSVMDRIETVLKQLAERGK